MQLGLLRHPVLQRSLPGDRGIVGETSEVDRRRTGWTFHTEGRHIRVLVFPLAALPHHVHPRGLWRDPGLLKQGPCDTIARPLRRPIHCVYLSSGVRQGACSTKLLIGERQ